MKKKSVMVVMHPRDRLREVLCERTCELARYLEDIESAKLKSREITSKGVIRCVHIWRARANVASLLGPHVEAGFLEWTGRTEWRADEYESRWLVEPRFMNDAPLCEAIMSFSPAIGGKGTRVELEIELLRGERSTGFQSITSTILTTHFRKLVEAAARLIEDN